MEVKNQILMVGCGNMADTWSPYLRSREDCEVVAVVDIDPAATARVKREYGFDCPACTSITKALDAESQILSAISRFPVPIWQPQPSLLTGNRCIQRKTYLG